MDKNSIRESHSCLHAGHRIRLRRRARKEGLKNFNEHQLLELLLSFVIARKDTNDLAHKLINKFGSIKNIITAPYDMLVNFDGLGDASASFLALLPDVIASLNEYIHLPNTKISSTAQAVAYFNRLFQAVGYEKVIALFLDNSGEIVQYYTSDTKEKDHVVIDKKQIQSIALGQNIKKVIIAHNHPNGNCYPSTSDVDTTRDLFLSLYMAGVELVDHCIISASGEYYSMRSSGILAKFREQTVAMLSNIRSDNNF